MIACVTGAMSTEEQKEGVEQQEVAENSSGNDLETAEGHHAAYGHGYGGYGHGYGLYNPVYNRIGYGHGGTKKSIH